MTLFSFLVRRSHFKGRRSFLLHPKNPNASLLLESSSSSIASSRARGGFPVGTRFKQFLAAVGGGGSYGRFGAGEIPRFPRVQEPRWISSQPLPASEPKTTDGLTVDAIAAKGWLILDENESDWRSHAAAIAQSVQLIKKRLQWRRLIARVDQLSVALNKPDLWDDPVYAGRISREHGEQLGRIKEVKKYEEELLEHIDLIKLARDENDKELESESMNALVNMRRNAKEKELEALLSGDNDSCSCFIEVVLLHSAREISYETTCRLIMFVSCTLASNCSFQVSTFIF